MKLFPLVLVTFLLVPGLLEAQFSSDIPGVPRARVPYLSGNQGRFELGLVGYRLRGEQVDTIGGSVRMGFGHSFRIAGAFEFGYDVTLGEFRMLSPGSAPGGEAPSKSMDGTFGYAARFGLKYQLLGIRDPEGYGMSASVGASFQPALKPVFSFSRAADSTVTRGYAGGAPRNGDPDQILVSTTGLLGAVGYRSPRVHADFALQYSIASTPTGISPVESFDGVFASIGAKVFLTESFALGGSFWGTGPPPWRGRIPIQQRPSDSQQGAFIVSFGGLEHGTDIIISSPTNDFSESASFFVRFH